MTRNKISILIPVYNRAHLIAETLNSILKQSYPNWECIVVDDGSDDDTLKIIRTFGEQDPRIQIYERPESFSKGANSCRNYAFQKSSGNFVVWFDSDDLMTYDHIECKLKEVINKKLDFVVARTQNFKDGEKMAPYEYEKKQYGIKAQDFILLKIKWYTYDVMLSRKIAEKISWNEKMKSWQDYNYFCKMLLITENGNYLDKILTYRRIHSNSIQKSLNKDSKTFNAQLLENRVLTYFDITNDINSFTRKELVYGMMNICFELSKINMNSDYIKEVEKIVENQLGIKSKYFFKMALVMGRISRTGHFILNKAKGR